MNISKTTDYVGNKIYENGVLKRILIDGGYIEASKYRYYQTDHLGNNRVVADNTGAIVQSTHYYPFGMAFAEGTGEGKQPYKYNGKELDAQHGLNTYDYAARYMDPRIGRFSSVDPLAEKYYSWSPYAYVGNNPMRYIDPTGRFRMDANQAKQYPRLAHYLANTIQEIQNNPRIMSALMKHGHLTESQIKEHLTWGKGPRVNITDLSLRGYDVTEVYGFFNHTFNPFAINIGENWAQLLEGASGADRDVLLFILAVTTLHEYVHYAEYNAGKVNYMQDGGNLFEVDAYGKMAFYGDDSAKNMLQNWMQRQKKQEQQDEKRTLATKSFLNDIVSGSVKEGTYVWNGNSWIKQ